VHLEKLSTEKIIIKYSEIENKFSHLIEKNRAQNQDGNTLKFVFDDETILLLRR